MKTFKESEEYIYNLTMFGIKLGLEQTFDLLNRLNNPHEKLKFIHLAGTNGKGSTAAILSAALQNCHFNIGFYSSPHLISIKERFRYNNELISDEDFVSILTEMESVIETMKQEGHCPTFFEITTAISFLYFKKMNVDFVILETGMGGRFDATNVVDSICSIITSISVDHKDYLGDTVAKIAYEKAGIIKENSILFTGDIPKEGVNVIEQEANLRNSQIISTKNCEVRNWEIIDDNPKYQSFYINNKKINLSLNGKYQIKNAKLAFIVLKHLSEEYNFSFDKAIAGFAKVSWNGRFQIIDNFIIDGAHNPEATELLVSSLNDYFPNEKFDIIFANFADKDTDKILEILAPISNKIIFTSLSSIREDINSKEFAKNAEKKYKIKTEYALNIDEAFQFISQTNKTLFTGSLYLAGEVLQKI